MGQFIQPGLKPDELAAFLEQVKSATKGVEFKVTQNPDGTSDVLVTYPDVEL